MKLDGTSSKERDAPSLLSKLTGFRGSATRVAVFGVRAPTRGTTVAIRAGSRARGACSASADGPLREASRRDCETRTPLVVAATQVVAERPRKRTSAATVAAPGKEVEREGLAWRASVRVVRGIVIVFVVQATEALRVVTGRDVVQRLQLRAVVAFLRHDGNSALDSEEAT